MKNKILNINKDFLKRKKYLKKEIKRITLLSIIRNLNVKPLIRANALKKLCFFKRNYSISRQNNNICLITGRNKGVLNLSNMSRHQLKKLSTVGNIQNLKIKSW